MKTNTNAVTNFYLPETFFLSNLYPLKHLVFLPDLEKGFSSVENAYQAAKVNSVTERKRIALMSPEAAKEYGAKIKPRKGWEKEKLEIMKDLLHQKFFNNPELGDRLLATGDSPILKIGEDNFWGCYWDPANKSRDPHAKHIGANHIGEISMSLRQELRLSKNVSV